MSKHNNCVAKFKILMESFTIKLISNLNQMATMRGDEHFQDYGFHNSTKNNNILMYNNKVLQPYFCEIRLLDSTDKNST